MTKRTLSKQESTPTQNLIERALARWENEGGRVQQSQVPRGVIFDMSQHARANAGIEMHEPENDTELHKLLAEQNSALQAAHMRLRMSDRMASIGALAAGLGHDMNNVLLPVQAHLNAARALTMIPEVREHVTAVQKSVTYLQQLADALHFLALDTDGEDSERAVTDVRAWWSQVGPLLTKAVPKHVKVTVSLPKDLPKVAISAHGLTQAILNLVVNAGQAIPLDEKRRQGRVRIWAKAIKSDHDKDGRSICLGVTDNGVGMSPEVQRNAFEMFYTTKTRGLGTGLGLPLVARVVKRAGGSVRIDSELEKGTTVQIILPAAHESDRTEAIAAVITLTDGRAGILIQRILESAGVQVADRDDPENCDIWIVEPQKNHLNDAQSWRRRNHVGRLVLLGEPNSRSKQEWKSLRPITIRDASDLDAIRTALNRAIANF